MLEDTTFNCTYKISEQLVTLADNIVNQGKYTRFPNLQKKVKNIFEQIIKQNVNITNKKIHELLEAEEHYVWTDSDNFHVELNRILKNLNMQQGVDIKSVRQILQGYFNTVIANFQHNVPKIIMFNLVKQTNVNINSQLYNTLNNSKPLIDLLQEPKEIHEKRSSLENQKKIFLTALKSIEDNQ